MYKRKFTRQFFFYFKIPYTQYENRLRHLKLWSLAQRRLYFDEVLLFKIISSHLNSRVFDSIEVITNYRTLRYQPTLHIPFANNNLLFYSPMIRIQRQHEKLFRHLSLWSGSVESFKTAVWKVIDQADPEF